MDNMCKIVIRLTRSLVLCVLPLILFACSTAKPSVRGSLLYKGKPASGISSAEPSFWFRNEETNKLPKPKVVYENGVFKISDLPAGKFGMSIDINETGKKPCCYPGDYNAWTTFSVADNMTSYVKANLRQIIRLTSPVDNALVIPLWDARCMDRIVFPGPVKFSWDSIGNGVYYDYLIVRVICPFKEVGIAAQGSTEETGITVDLPPSRDNEFYLFSLNARKGGRPVGMLMTHGKSGGYGWDLRFRVK